ncbi:putative nuclease HARBI1 isoform X2 [Lucilia cuprina]|nr:putative nuclease HARBI1 isoform X2 [Lucilia cuprina]XP_046801078.1 putative nuclease HARBI1 isoform X2 [Lucilia cuprina]
MTQAEEQHTKLRIHEKFNFPGVIGFVDGTHIRIKCPSRCAGPQGDTDPGNNRQINPVSYYNRKGYHSINAMIICDDKLLIRFVDARHPGSNHDSFIWKSSQADQYLNNLHTNGKRNFWLLGDSGYPLLPYLMTPLRNCTNHREELYNKSHIQARNTVERCIGVLKNRFRCILGERGLHYEPERVIKIINVCCAVHNACINYNDDLSEDVEIQHNFESDMPDGNASTIGNEIRSIINNFY